MAWYYSAIETAATHPPLTRMDVCASQTLIAQSTMALRTPAHKKTVHCRVSGHPSTTLQPPFNVTTWQRATLYNACMHALSIISCTDTRAHILRTTHEWQMIYVYSDPDLQNGTRLVGLSLGTQKCANKNRTLLRKVQSNHVCHGFPRLNSMGLKLLTQYVNSRFMDL